MKKNTYNIILWVVQVLLAVAFGMSGAMKTFQSIEELSAMLPWVAETSSLLVRLIGVSELLGALGLILPALLKIQPKFVSMAAYGLALVMVLALIFHVSRGEFEAIGANVVLVGLAIFIAWGRTKKAPIVAS